MEIMVVMSITVLLSGVILFNYSSFSDNLALSSAGQEVLLTLRQAQQYGISVKESSAGSGQFNYAYGVSFDNRDVYNYYFFVDRNNNRTFDIGDGCGSSNTECVSKETFRNGVRVYDVCDNNSCPPHPNITGMQVTFMRPNPDAEIDFSNNNGVLWGDPQPLGKVKLISAKGKTLNITIESTGQIYEQ